MLAAYKLRAVPINVNYRYVEDELVYLFDNADVVAVVLPGRVLPADRGGARPAADAASTSSSIDDGTGTPIDAGAVDYEDALAGGVARA